MGPSGDSKGPSEQIQPSFTTAPTLHERLHGDGLMIARSVVDALGRIVGPENVAVDQPTLEAHSLDAFGRWGSGGPESPNPQVQAVVRPASTEEVSTIVKLANREGIPVVPYGGGTGVMGAVTPLRGGIAVDLKRMGRVMEINPQDRSATVGAGIVLGVLNEALAPAGLMLGHDPYSVPIATVGGAISTNGVGYRAARYGSMGEQVLGLEVVLPTGAVIETRAVPKTSAGPSLQHLFIGSQGVMGIITRATLRVFRLPEARVLKTISFTSFADGFQAMLEMFSLGLKPALVDVTEEPAGATDRYETTMYLVFEGYAEEVEAQVARTLKVCTAAGGEDIGPDRTQVYWDTRHDSAYRYKERFLDRPVSERPAREWPRSMDYPHVALPASKVLEYRLRCQDIVEKYGLQVREYAVWTQPELYSMILVDISAEGRADGGALRRAADAVLTLAQDMGGSMDYVHGVGVKLAHLMPRELGEAMDTLRSIKAALDPRGIMNPGHMGL